MYDRGEDCLGTHLYILDTIVRSYASYLQFDENSQQFVCNLRKVAKFRRNVEKNESADECFERLKKDSKVFANVYKGRNSESVLK